MFVPRHGIDRCGMAGLIFSDPTVKPGTHVLIVGVGHYPHLGNHIQIPGLEQLESPPRSARELTRWFLEEFRHSKRPLASLFLLLSEQQPAPLHWTDAGGQRRILAAPGHRSILDPRPDDTVALADWNNFKQASLDWRARGHEHAQSQMIFFFSGHGLGLGAEAGLLLENFGDDPLGAFTGVVNVNQMRQAATLAQARNQTWFIDACRKSPGNVSPDMYLGQSPIQSGRVPPNWPRCANPIYHSTLRDMEAYARPQGLTLFTDALLGALRGGGADTPGDGSWRVETGQLMSGLGEPMKFAARSVGKLQIAGADGISEDFVLCELPGAPEVPTFVECSSPLDTYDRRLQYKRVSNGALRSVGPGKDFWRVVLTPDTYEFKAALPNAPGSGIPSHFEVRPPSRAYKVQS